MASNTTTVKRDPYAELSTIPTFSLESSVVAEGETMPIAQRDGIFGSGGRDTSPDLTWSGFPNETRSFIVTMNDPDERVLALGRHQPSCVRNLVDGRSRRRRQDIAGRIDALA